MTDWDVEHLHTQAAYREETMTRMTPPIKDDTVMFDQTAPRMTEERRAEAEDTLCHHPSSEYLAQYLREALDEIEALRAVLAKMGGHTGD